MSYKNSKIPQETKDEIVEKYLAGLKYSEVAQLFDVHPDTVRRLIKKLNIPSNGTERKSQKYQLFEDHAEIQIKTQNKYVQCLIDLDDVDKCKKIGIWSLTKDGYVINCQSGIYIHRLIMDCPDDMEVDHIFHNLLDNRKQYLRLATSSQQKMNTKRRKDNTSNQRGVYWDSERGQWHVNIKNLQQRITARFDNYQDACIYAQKAINKLHGDYQYRCEV